MTHLADPDETAADRTGPAVATIGHDPDAFEAFYRDHLPLIRTYLARRLDDPATVADLTGEVFLRAIRGAAAYRADLGPPRAWLVGIARHAVADHHRTAARERSAVLRLHARRLLDEDSAQRIVERIAAQSEARAVLVAVAELPDTLRHVVELVAVDGLPVHEAAAVLGIRPGTARVRYHRARALLRHSLPVRPDEVTP